MAPPRGRAALVAVVCSLLALLHAASAQVCNKAKPSNSAFAVSKGQASQRCHGASGWGLHTRHMAGRGRELRELRPQMDTGLGDQIRRMLKLNHCDQRSSCKARLGTAVWSESEPRRLFSHAGRRLLLVLRCKPLHHWWSVRLKTRSEASPQNLSSQFLRGASSEQPGPPLFERPSC